MKPVIEAKIELQDKKGVINMTWDELVLQEPKLQILYDKLKLIKDTGEQKSFCANSIWFGYPNSDYFRVGFKKRMSFLVGWGAPTKNDLLKSSEAYDVAYETLYKLLPGCRNCAEPSAEDFI